MINISKMINNDTLNFSNKSLSLLVTTLRDEFRRNYVYSEVNIILKNRDTLKYK